MYLSNCLGPSSPNPLHHTLYVTASQHQPVHFRSKTLVITRVDLQIERIVVVRHAQILHHRPATRSQDHIQQQWQVTRRQDHIPLRGHPKRVQQRNAGKFLKNFDQMIALAPMLAAIRRRSYAPVGILYQNHDHAASGLHRLNVYATIVANPHV